MKTENYKILGELDAEAIIDIISEYSYVTFDVFDTLIKRDVNSFKDIVKLMQIRYFETTGRGFPFYFYRERIHSPKAVKRRLKREADIFNMYQIMHIKDKEVIRELECQVELAYITANPVMYKVYKYCKESGKKIYAISDMYLSEECIKKMLIKCGYDIDCIYVSQKENATKSSCGLYGVFLKKNKLNCKDVVHIGDNYSADVLGANKCGIYAIKIPNQNNIPKYLKKVYIGQNLEQNILYKYVNNRLDLLDNREQKIGFEILGPVLYYFTLWLHQRIKKYHLNKIFFLARDGYLLMKAYEYLFGTQECSCYYLSISTKAAKEAYLDENKKELLQQYLKQNEFYGTVAIVDIGWGGNLHKLIKKLSEDFATVYGFYFATSKPFEKNINDNVSTGYLQLNRIKRTHLKMNGGFIELLFSDTDSGTTLGYKRQNETIYPCYSKESPNGLIIKDIQKGAMAFVKDWHKNGYTLEKVSKEFLCSGILNLSLYPCKVDVDVIKMEYKGDGEEYCKVADSKGKKYYSKNWLSFLKDLRNICWKGGFLRETFCSVLWNKLYVFLNTIIILFQV